MTNTFITERTSPRQPNWLTILRVGLGLLLFWKAISFIRNTAMQKALIEQANIGVFSDNSEILAFVVTYLGLLCGLFITVGLFTKAASIVQIPVLIVAVFFINIRNINDNVFEFILSLIALGLLILFAIKGSGILSADEYFHRGAEQDEMASERRGLT